MEIGRDVDINRAIIAEGCSIPSGMKIGVDHDQDRARGFRISLNGIVLVTKTMLQNLREHAPWEQNSNMYQLPKQLHS